MMDIKVLASSSEGNAYLVSDGATRLLIECGIPWKEIQQKTDFVLPDACLVSHSHGDHARSVNDIMRLGIYCYMSDETSAEADYDTIHSTWQPLEHLHERHIFSFKVLPLKMEHDVSCLGFCIYSKATKESLFFATDTCCIPYRVT